MLNFEPKSKKTDVAMAVEYLTRVMKRRSTVFVLSDFFVSPEVRERGEAFEHALTMCNRKHDMVAIQVYDQRAKILPDIGLMKVRDAETGHEMFIDTSSKKLRLAHTHYFMERQNFLQQTFTKSNVDWTSIATSDDYVKSLLMLFKQRG